MDRLDSLKRRGFLGGALATALGTLGVVGTASAEQSTPQDREQALGDAGVEQMNGGVPPHQHRGPQDGGTVLHPEVLLHRARTTNQHASSQRPIISTEPHTLHVAPNGDDSNDGSQGNPLATPQEALDRAPLFLQHRFHIQLADGTYDGDLRSGPGHLVGSKPHNPHPFRIQGNPNDPSRVVLDGNPTFSFRSNEMDNPVITDLTVTGTLKNQDSHYQARNIRFTGTGDHVNGGSGYKAHNPSITLLRDCTFADTYDSAIEVTLGGRVMLDNCSGSVSNYAINVEKGSTVTAIGNNDLSGGQGFVNATRGGRFVRQDGTVLNASNSS